MAGLDLVNTAIFVGAALVVIGIFSSLIATRFGAPLLLVFLVVGMLAGEDGPGGLPFSNYTLTYLVGSVALAVVLFDGGLRTRLSTFRGVLAPSMLLATVGVLLTAALTGLAAWAALGLAPIEALLLGAIVASTDAAAVFFLLRTGGLRLQSRVGSTLEIESGANDPIAVFLVILLTERILSGGHAPGWELVLDVAGEGVFGTALGLLGGFGLVAVLNNIPMPGGLHPLFVVSGAVLIYGLTAMIEGSGFLAVYVAGLVVANRPARAYPSIVGFHDAVTWLCQIVMFLLLGMLVTPTALLDYALPGLFVAVALTAFARPVAVWLCLSPFGFRWNEKAFVSWVGLRGAVSIFLAAIPTLAGVPHAPLYFNVAFFVVLLSLLVQGSTLTRAARRLGVALRTSAPNPSRVEIDIPGQTEQEIAGYPVHADSVILGLSRPPGFARLLMLVRRGEILDAAAAGGLRPGDYVYFLVPRERLSRLDSLFRESPEVARRLDLLYGELPIRGDTPIGDLARFYDLDFGGADPSMRIGAWIATRLGPRPALDTELTIPGGRLAVRRIETGQVSSVGLRLDEMLEADRDEVLMRRLEEDDSDIRRARRWLERFRRPSGKA